MIGKPDDELERMLTDLQLGEFIYEQPAFPDVEYIFKHALTQEVAYNSVLIERRKLLHERAARRLRRCSPSSSTSICPSWRIITARSDNIAKAVEYLRRAGELAMKRLGSTAEAIAQLSAALDLVKSMPSSPEREQRETNLRMTLRALLLYDDE